MVQPSYIQADCLYIIVEYSVKSRHTLQHKDGHTERTQIMYIATIGERSRAQTERREKRVDEMVSTTEYLETYTHIHTHHGGLC